MDVSPLVVDMVKAVNDFEDGSYAKIADGIEQLGYFIAQVGIIMNDCAAISDTDKVKLVEMGEAFLHPKQLIIDAEHNVIVNGVEIFKDVRAAGKEMAASHFMKAGEMYGEIAALVLWGHASMEANGIYQ